MTTIKNVTDKSIEDTGERMIPAYHKGKLVYGEHLVRYQALEELVQDKIVLDIASGSGYGTSVISNSAKKVFGVDVDKDAIDYASKNYGSSKIEFIKGDGRDIPLPDNAVEVVVSFETIEHIEDYKYFMKEVKRVLKDDGLFVLSTPNDEEFPEGAHFHIHEFERKELQTLVKEYFKNSKEYFQATWLYNALVEEGQLKNEGLLPLKTLHTAPVNADKAIYFYMLLANREIQENVPALGAISQHWSDREMLEHNKEMEIYIRKTIKHFEGIIAEKEKQLSQLRESNAEFHRQAELAKKSFPRRAREKVKAARKKVQNE